MRTVSLIVLVDVDYDTTNDDVIDEVERCLEANALKPGTCKVLLDESEVDGEQ